MNQSQSKRELKCMENIAKLMDQGKFESVIMKAEDYIKEFPKQEFFYTGIGLAYSESGDVDTGISYLKEAEKKFPDSYELLFQLGKMYEEKSEYSEAIKYFYKSFDKTPSEHRRARAECYNDIGVMLSELDDEEQAIKLWKEALVIDPANENAKYNLKNLETTGTEEDTEEVIKDELRDFTFYQMCKYLAENGKTKFTSKKEQKNFKEHVEDAFLKEIMPRMIEIEQMSEEDKIDFYEDTEINFDEPVLKLAIPELGDEVSAHLQNVFPYLPDDGIIMIMLVLPALEYAGISEIKLNNFISQTEAPDSKETRILKWAYEIGTRIYEFSNITGSKKSKASFNEIIKLLNQELDENDSLIVMDSILDRLSDSDELF